MKQVQLAVQQQVQQAVHPQVRNFLFIIFFKE